VSQARGDPPAAGPPAHRQQAGGDIGAETELDQTAADADQTSADADQTLSDADQVTSETDASLADADQKVSNHDQALADRDHEGRSTSDADEAYERSRAERTRGTLSRRLTAEERTGAARSRLAQSARRDENAQQRDNNAAVRDRAADERDRVEREAEEPEHTASGLTAARSRLAGARESAAAARRRAARDRADAARDRQLALEELREARADYAERVDHLAGGMAHNINNLMAIILGYADRELKRAQTPASREDLEAIITAANRAVALTGQLLAFAGLTASGRSPVDANQALSAFLEAQETPADSAITVDVALDPGNPWLALDSAQFSQIVGNLVLNANEAMVPGGTLTLATASHTILAAESAESGLPEGDYVDLSVADTGVGIPDDELGQVMDVFFTTKGPAHAGLGLSTVRGIVDAAGGSIDVQSEVGAGTKISITLPCAEPATPTAA
jgi:signal transduction histidine kinase